MKFCKHSLSPGPKEQLTESGLHGKQGLWVHKEDVRPWGWGWAVVEKLCKAKGSMSGTKGLCFK